MVCLEKNAQTRVVSHAVQSLNDRRERPVFDSWHGEHEKKVEERKNRHTHTQAKQQPVDAGSSRITTNQNNF